MSHANVKCKNCKSVDNSGLVFNPNYTGAGVFTKVLNEHDENNFNVDGMNLYRSGLYEIPHAVCQFLRRN